MAQIRTDRPGDRVAVVTLDDPSRRNALSLQLSADLASTIEALVEDPEVGAVVVTGDGPAFCAGADLTQLGDSAREGLLAIYEGFLAVARCPLPTIAAVNGPAVGAGMNLALACDVRLAGESARFDTRFLQLDLRDPSGQGTHTWDAATCWVHRATLLRWCCSQGTLGWTALLVSICRRPGL